MVGMELWDKNAEKSLVQVFLGCFLRKCTLEIKVHKERLAEGGKSINNRMQIYLREIIEMTI